MFPRRAVLAAALLGSCLATAGRPAHAHHEAIFGPQSSLLLSQPAFASLQAFSKRRGLDGMGTQDTTFLASAGLSPFERVPLSFALTVPAAWEVDESGHDHAALEDLLLGARYRQDLTGLQQATGKEGNFLMAVAAVELPTGTAHGGPFDRPPSLLTAAFGSLERGRLSLMAFVFNGLNFAGSDRSRDGHELFLGGGVAYTPVDGSDRLLSLQLGASHEYLFRDVADGQAVASSGGGQLMVGPTVVAGLGEHWQIFATAAFPALQKRRDPRLRDAWRLGAGAIYAFGHEHD